MARTTLATLGIEEVESNVCEDSVENRRVLREAGVRYKILDVGFIEVNLDQLNEQEEKRRTLHERNRLILSNPKNPWSDYLPFDELPLEFWETAPAWMQRLRNEYNDAVARGEPERRIPLLPGRCRRQRADGSRCFSWAWNARQAEGYCRFHAPPGSFEYASQFNKLTEAARARLIYMQSDALDALEDLVSNTSAVPAVRLRAAENILDRTGIRGGTELTVSGQIEHSQKDPAQEVRERLNALAERITPAALPEARSTRESSSSEDLPIETVEEPVEAELIEMADDDQ